MKRKAQLGDRVFWFDEMRQPYPATIVRLLVDPKTGEHESSVILTVFGRYNVESGIIAERHDKPKADHWSFDPE